MFDYCVQKGWKDLNYAIKSRNFWESMFLELFDPLKSTDEYPIMVNAILDFLGQLDVIQSPHRIAESMHEALRQIETVKTGDWKRLICPMIRDRVLYKIADACETKYREMRRAVEGNSRKTWFAYHEKVNNPIMERETNARFKKLISGLKLSKDPEFLISLGQYISSVYGANHHDMVQKVSLVLYDDEGNFYVRREGQNGKGKFFTFPYTIIYDQKTRMRDDLGMIIDDLVKQNIADEPELKIAAQSCVWYCHESPHEVFNICSMMNVFLVKQYIDFESLIGTVFKKISLDEMKKNFLKERYFGGVTMDDVIMPWGYESIMIANCIWRGSMFSETMLCLGTMSDSRMTGLKNPPKMWDVTFTILDDMNSHHSLRFDDVMIWKNHLESWVRRIFDHSPVAGMNIAREDVQEGFLKIHDPFTFESERMNVSTAQKIRMEKIEDDLYEALVQIAISEQAEDLVDDDDRQ